MKIKNFCLFMVGCMVAFSLFSHCDIFEDDEDDEMDTAQQENTDSKNEQEKNPSDSGAGSNSNESDQQLNDKIDTARDVDYMNNMEKSVLRELNLVRYNPKAYAEKYIKPLLTTYQGSEGTAAVKDCFEQLSNTQPLKMFMPAKGLALCAQQHALTSAPVGHSEHVRVDGTPTFDAFRMYGSAWAMGEDIQFGYSTARDIVLDLLIDDGIASRGHRENIIRQGYNFCGIGYSDKHKIYRTMCVIDFAAEWVDKEGL